MESSKETQADSASNGPIPRVWVMSMRSSDPGYQLHQPQSIRSALQSLMMDPNIGMAYPLAPGKSALDFDYSEDISTINDHKGFILTLSIAEAQQINERSKELLEIKLLE
ncbi:hypothetical protein PSACC_00254 [Paramicrosporidium saccamoebae]|uniref:Uncharacterized protein n=1 Tax=Paramicrosporidium saccamoebae TaxID=1246581 RepID=A0A2H9TQC2_9FUNG|nr:hypothetical protein PSACC_00254 [Paramicrosporidium saccamoebae]